MMDGDGAQEVSVSVAGAAILFLASGASSVHTITANTGDIIELSFNGPIYLVVQINNGECSFTLSDPNGAEDLFDSGTDPQPGLQLPTQKQLHAHLCNVPTALSASNYYIKFCRSYMDCWWN